MPMRTHIKAKFIENSNSYVVPNFITRNDMKQFEFTVGNLLSTTMKSWFTVCPMITLYMSGRGSECAH